MYLKVNKKVRINTLSCLQKGNDTDSAQSLLCTFQNLLHVSELLHLSLVLEVPNIFLVRVSLA